MRDYLYNAERTWAERVLDHGVIYLVREMQMRGSFMSMLGDALVQADTKNAMKILTTWQYELEPMLPLTPEVCYD